MLIWLNGPFGVGKTSTAEALRVLWPDLIPFDTEQIGYALEHALKSRLPVDDFQDWVSWRAVSVAALVAVSAETGADLVVPQTVLLERYWAELMSGLEAAGISVRAFTLHVDADEHRRRIGRDALEQPALAWRLDRRAAYDAALPWLSRRTQLIDTTTMSVEQVAAAVGARAAL